MQPQFDNSYIKLPEHFYAHQQPVAVKQPKLIGINRPLADFLGIDADWLASDEGVAMIAGNLVPEGSEPIATVYAGHQFGQWNPRLGDGRAVLLGEVIASNGERYDLQLKGSGRTPFSRGGDGRAPLGPVIREYLLCEAMFALNIPTSRTLAAVASGEPVFREQALPGGVLVRVAKSHIRVGTMQYFRSIDDTDGLRALADHVMQRHYPQAMEADNPALALYQGIIGRQATLIAQWMAVGFIHGVMNTDNMLLSGETVDYGPCAFMDEYSASQVYSSIDHQGRYAYRNQAPIANWNLACLGNAMLPLFDDDEEKATELAQETLNHFAEQYWAAHYGAFNAKLGLSTAAEGDDSLVNDLLELMERTKSDFTLSFRRLADLADDGEQQVADLFDFSPKFDDWLERWRQRCAQEATSAADRQQQMRSVNPVFIPRNHLVEKAIEEAYDGNLDFFNRLQQRLEQPFDWQHNDYDLALPPTSSEIVRQTFCGT